MPVSQVVENIERKVARLIEENRNLRTESARMAVDRERLRTDNRELQAEVKALKSDLAKAQLSAGLLGNASDKRAAKSRINRLMREVDNCITLLGETK